VVASLVPAAAMGKEHHCTVVALPTVAVPISTVGDGPSTTVEDDAVVLSVGYAPCGTSE
jgi:hypothetical protein